MDVRSYPGKVFVIENDQSVIRDENLAPLKYKAGDEIPPGSHVGDTKKIPPGTEINVTDVKAPDRKNVFVLARPANNGAGSFGWTRADNLAGGFVGEVTGFAPAKFEKEPEGNNKTCVDAQAFIRSGPPNFASTGNLIPQKSFVTVTDTSEDKEHVKVSKLELVNSEMVVGDEIGWTKAMNLMDGCLGQFFTDELLDKKGPNACWRRGNFIGAKTMVNIIGNGVDMEQITFDSLAPYLELARAAAGEDDLTLSINSAFRTFQRQAELFELSHHGGHTAAEPGKSNHQHGQAFDLNTEENVFDGTDKIYEWLKKNGPKHGFIRTVNKESWHWEYRPADAAQMGPGEFKLPPGII